MSRYLHRWCNCNDWKTERSSSVCSCSSAILYPQRTTGHEKMPECLKSVLDKSVKIANKLKGKPLNTRLFRILCEEMGGKHTKHLFSHWNVLVVLGKFLTPLFELGDEEMLFLYHSDELYNQMPDFQWLVKLPYLADIFRTPTLNTLNVMLQGNTDVNCNTISTLENMNCNINN